MEKKSIIIRDASTEEEPYVVHIWTPAMSREDVVAIQGVEGVLSVYVNEYRIIAWLNPCYDFSYVTDRIIALFEDEQESASR